MNNNQLLPCVKKLLFLLSKISIEHSNHKLEDCYHKSTNLLDSIKKNLDEFYSLDDEANHLHYILCAVSDELIAKNSQDYCIKNVSLLNRYHQDTNGGDKFYTYLDDWLLHKRKYIDFIEIAYICLTLGFEGKYALMTNSEKLLADKKNNMSYIINIERQYNCVSVFNNDSLFKKPKIFKKNMLVILFFSLILICSFTVYSLILNHEIASLQSVVFSLLDEGYVSSEH